MEPAVSTVTHTHTHRQLITSATRRPSTLSSTDAAAAADVDANDDGCAFRDVTMVSLHSENSSADGVSAAAAGRSGTSNRRLKADGSTVN